jgi:hypothetical protein
MSFCEIDDHKILDVFKIKQYELELFEKSWNRGYISACRKHTDYYERHRNKLKTYLEKKGYPFDNDINIIGTFNENTREIIKNWKLCDGQGIAVYLDFEKGSLYIGDIL